QERRGERNIPAHQILFELGWLDSSTRDTARFRARLDDLAAALKDPANRSAVDEQSPVDGAWGRWYTEPFFKLDASYEQIAVLAGEGRLPKHPCRFLDRYNSPERLVAHLNTLLVSDLAADGIRRRRELNQTVSDLLRLIHRRQPADYPFHPQLDAAMLDWLMNTARDPATGYWGGWYRRDGRIEKTTDLSITFHIISYLDGEVPDWPRILDTTLAIKDRAYPTGWLSGNAYLNHNNMDVVRIFELGWRHASEAQKAAIRVECRKMLDWCLRESLRPDGSFVVLEDDDSVETSIYFGTAFLVRIGYFDRARRFWTDADFPRAAADRAHLVQFIRTHLHSGGEGGTYYRSALAALGEPLPSP
ncbi:MAG: hypothetical protein NTV51_19435, partial [Verrucomicrobia bacterium]|nr:hypothetical protein [Verrucomicrobiota bacterium]